MLEDVAVWEMAKRRRQGRRWESRFQLQGEQTGREAEAQLVKLRGGTSEWRMETEKSHLGDTVPEMACLPLLKKAF